MKHLNNQALLEHTHHLVSEERRITVEILHALREIEKRRLYATQGYASLWEMMRHSFGYSEGATQRRISAMRLLKENPELERKIESGEISLSVAAQAQTFLKGHVLPAEERKEFLEKLEGKSSREAEREIRTLAPVEVPREKERRLTDELTEIRLVVDEDLKKKLEALKARHSHKSPNMSYQELLRLLVNAALDAPSPPTSEVEAQTKAQTKSATKAATKSATKAELKAGIKKEGETKTLTPRLKRQTLARDGYRCTHTTNDKRCEATYFLEVDHIKPKFLGGTNAPANLRTLCRAHNLQAAGEKLGEELMARYRVLTRE